jgi:hypothetical protein
MGVVSALSTEDQPSTVTRSDASVVVRMGCRVENEGRTFREGMSRCAARTATEAHRGGASGAECRSVSGGDGVHEVSRTGGALIAG